MSETLYIIDTFSLVFQVYHAIRQPMTGTRGQPTNAIYGFVGDLHHLIRDKQPTHLVCAMESDSPGERLTIYEDYKANRSSMPEDLRPQIPLIMDVLEGFRIPVISYAGWEADDVIATLAKSASSKGMDVRIVSSDKDFRQLISPKVKIYSIRKKQFMDEQGLMQEWGVTPEQVIDFQALIGDSVDNVPGVPGIGPKTAKGLLEKFGTLDTILQNIDQVSAKKVSENLRTYHDQALMSRDLVTLRTELPLEVDWEKLALKDPDNQRLFDLYTDFGFRRYADEMHSRLVETKEIPPPQTEREWFTVDTPAALVKLLEDLASQPLICVDLETTSTNPMQADIVGWAISWKPGTAYYIPVDGPSSEKTVNAEQVIAGMKPILEDPNRTIVNQNIKYDMLVLRQVGIQIANPGLDPMIGDYLLDAGARSHGMTDLAKRYLSREVIPISELIGKGKQQKKMFEVEIEKTAEYASEDADIGLQLSLLIEEKLKQQDLWELYWNVERPLIPVLVEMESNGIRVDIDELKNQSYEVSTRLQTLMTEIYQAAGTEFNIDSPKQLGKVLFEDLKLPVQKRTKTGPSTDQEVLERLAPLHPLPKLLTEHRMLSKLRGTYLDALPTLVNPKTGNVHTSFSQVTAATGRLSSSDPNLQNIPIRTVEGSRIRRAFIPSRPDWKLVCLDYSQIELRMLAHFSKDAELQEAFRKGEDIHTAVAAQVFGVPLEEVTSSQRRIAKAVNFGVIYGQSPYGLAAALSIPQEEAAQFIEDYFNKYSSVHEFMETTLNDVRRDGFAQTILGRRRSIDGIRPKRIGNLNMAERTAVNAVIQGSAADLIKTAMIKVYERLNREQHPARMLLQIHDELVFETPADDVNSLIELARHEMSSALDLDVPVVVDCKVGDNWLDAAPVD